MQTSRYKLSLAQYKHIIWHLHKVFRENKLRLNLLMLCKPLFIAHGRVKGFVKVILQYKNKAPQLQKWAWHMHNEIVAINTKYQCRSYCKYNKK